MSIQHFAECFALIDTSLSCQIQSICIVHYFIDAETESQRGKEKFGKIKIFQICKHTQIHTLQIQKIRSGKRI